MIADWLQIEPGNPGLPVGTFQVLNFDGVDCTLNLINGVLQVIDRGDVSRYDDNSLIANAPHLYRTLTGSFTGAILVDGGTQLNFVNNQRVN